MSYGRLLNDPAEAGGVHVYLREDRPLFTLAFENREWVEGFTPLSALLAVMIFGMVPAFLVMPYDWLILAYVAAMAVLFFLAKNPRKTRRTIVLDYEQDRMAVTRNERETFSAPISGLRSLTVEDHPQTAFERDQRARRGKRGTGKFEKQHVLVGWFGVEGSQRSELVSRYEWPKLYTLQSVGGAVNWVRRTAASASSEAGADDEDTGQPGGLGPPLD